MNAYNVVDIFHMLLHNIDKIKDSHINKLKQLASISFNENTTEFLNNLSIVLSLPRNNIIYNPSGFTSLYKYLKNIAKIGLILQTPLEKHRKLTFQLIAAIEFSKLKNFIYNSTVTNNCIRIYFPTFYITGPCNDYRQWMKTNISPLSTQPQPVEIDESIIDVSDNENEDMIEIDESILDNSNNENEDMIEIDESIIDISDNDNEDMNEMEELLFK